MERRSSKTTCNECNKTRTCEWDAEYYMFNHKDTGHIICDVCNQICCCGECIKVRNFRASRRKAPTPRFVSDNCVKCNAYLMGVSRDDPSHCIYLPCLHAVHCFGCHLEIGDKCTSCKTIITKVVGEGYLIYC